MSGLDGEIVGDLCRRTKTSVLAVGVLTLMTIEPARAVIIPAYQSFGTDAVWTHLGDGFYRVPTSAEDYPNEVWERPTKDGTWTDNADGFRYSSDEYWGYGDLSSAAFGVGTSEGTDYLFVRWSVVGGFMHKPDGKSGGAKDEGVGLKGHYYFYFQTPGEEALAIEVSDATGLPSSYADNGKVKAYRDTDGDVPGSGITTTEEGGTGYDTEIGRGLGRADTATSIVEVAVPLSVFGVSPADFTNLLFAYAGVAVSNPSAVSDLYTNDHFQNSPGKGVEYDTLRFSTGSASHAPEPASIALLSIGGLGIAWRRRRMRGAAAS